MPDTTTLVSATTRMRCASLLTSGLDLRFHFFFAKRRCVVVSHSVCALEEVIDTPPLNFFAEQGLD